jgi:hypothetical protein
MVDIFSDLFVCITALGCVGAVFLRGSARPKARARGPVFRAAFLNAAPGC